MSIDFTPKQLAAIDRANDWYNDPKSRRPFQLFGFAGTGKTTIAQKTAHALGVKNVFFCAPTGKAASNLIHKGCADAKTIHQLIYKPSGSGYDTRKKQIIEELQIEQDPRKRARLKRELDRISNCRFVPNPKSVLGLCDPSNSLVIVDEASMVGQRVGRDLASFGVKILALGDPAQLGPVKDTAYFTGRPDVVLDEIHRSEANSPVTHFATQVRTKGYISGRVDENGVIYRKIKDLKMKVFLSFDQVVTGPNWRRHLVNEAIRNHYGRTPGIPVKGDRVMCLQNDHHFGLLNGEQYRVLGVTDNHSHWGLTLQIMGTKDTLRVPAAKHTFFGQDYENDLPRRGELGAFAWGYAITGHKAQGSQWRRVLVLKDKWRGDNAQWLYTAVTRASERVVVISPPR